VGWADGFPASAACAVGVWSPLGYVPGVPDLRALAPVAGVVVALLYAHAPGCDGYVCATFSHRHSFGDAHAPGRDTYTHSDDTGHRHTARCHRHECPIRRHLRQRPDRG
jgi:hypothetical protein